MLPLLLRRLLIAPHLLAPLILFRRKNILEIVVFLLFILLVMIAAARAQ